MRKKIYTYVIKGYEDKGKKFSRKSYREYSYAIVVHLTDVEGNERIHGKEQYAGGRTDDSARERNSIEKEEEGRGRHRRDGKRRHQRCKG